MEVSLRFSRSLKPLLPGYLERDRETGGFRAASEGLAKPVLMARPAVQRFFSKPSHRPMDPRQVIFDRKQKHPHDNFLPDWPVLDMH